MVTYLGDRNKWFRNLAGLSSFVQVLSQAPKVKWENYVILAAEQKRHKTHFRLLTQM